MDFRGNLIENCILSDVVFNNCDFDDNTEFIKCKFQKKVKFENCVGVGIIKKISDCSFDSEAQDSLHNVIATIKISPQQVERWIYIFLKRFKSGIYFIKQGYNQLFTGIVFQKLDKEKFFEYFRKYNIITVETGAAGADELYLINNESRRDVSSFLENGIIGGNIKRVYDDLVKEYCS